MINRLLAILFVLFGLTSLGQGITSTIRGTVVDNLSEEPIFGASIILQGTDPLIGAQSDIDGRFKMENVPVGRYNVEIRYLGYQTIVLFNQELLTKELVLNIRMEELVNELKEVTVSTKKNGKPVNDMSTNSSRSFEIEESQRYAGSLGDVARMAQNFAGVQGADDSRNDIIVRGNSPTGVLYRLEGIDIPNPNHFAQFGTTGGPISMINPNMLAKSDFMTGAFPAEYGNANAGVFDLNLRNGNNEKHEFLAQVGFNGFEGMAEGPFSKKSRASYAINYRYSVLELLSLMGINFGTTAVPKYQDLSFKVNIPHKQGVTSVFGIGGISRVSLLAEQTDGTNDLYAIDRSNTDFKSIVGFMGVNHKQKLKKNSYLKLSVAVQASSNDIINDTVDNNYENAFNVYRKKSVSGKVTGAIHYINKLSAKHYIKTGVFMDALFFQLRDSVWRDNLTDYQTLRNVKTNTYLIRPYIAYQYKITNDLKLNLGVHYQHLTLANQWNIEPRFGLSYTIKKKNVLSFSYGYHSQMQPFELYFLETQTSPTESVRTNEELEFTKSHHFVLGYDLFMKWGLHFKAEAYAQMLTDVPVELKSSSYSILNFGASFYNPLPDSLVNNGSGLNYGIEITFEKRMDKGLYFMFNGALFQSKYKGSDGIARNTGFNGNFTTNLLGGYEHMFKQKTSTTKKGKIKPKVSISADVKFVLNGGGRYTEIDFAASELAGEEIWTDGINEKQYPSYFKMNFRFGVKFIMKKVTNELAFDLQNITNRQNIFYREYIPESNSIETTYQTGFLPLVLYRITF